MTLQITHLPTKEKIQPNSDIFTFFSQQTEEGSGSTPLTQPAPSSYSPTTNQNHFQFKPKPTFLPAYLQYNTTIPQLPAQYFVAAQRSQLVQSASVYADQVLLSQTIQTSTVLCQPPQITRDEDISMRCVEVLRTERFVFLVGPKRTSPFPQTDALTIK